MKSRYPRRWDWAQKLTEYIVASMQAGTSCDWENQNCGKWVSGAVREQTGRDVYGRLRDIKDPYTAYMEIKRAGYDDLEDLIRKNFRKKPIAFAHRGDIVFVRAEGDQWEGLGMAHALGIAEPPIFHALGTAGIGRGLILDAVACFDIEREPDDEPPPEEVA